MANMSYCRFQNTHQDVCDCIDALYSGETLSKEEAQAGRRMIKAVLRYCESVGIIDVWDRLQVDTVFEELTEK